MQVSTMIRPFDSGNHPITTKDLMLAFANGSYINVQIALGSNNHFLGKISKIELESGCPDGHIPTSFNVTLSHGSRQQTVFIRTLAK